MTTEQYQRASSRYDREHDDSISPIECELFPKFRRLSIAIDSLDAPTVQDTEALIDSVFDRIDHEPIQGFWGFVKSNLTH